MCDLNCKIHEVSSPLINKEKNEINNEINSPKRTLNYDSSELHGDGKQNKKPSLLQCLIFLFLTDIHLHSGAKKQKTDDKSAEIKGGYCSSKGVILWMQVSETIFFVDSGAPLPSLINKETNKTNN